MSGSRPPPAAASNPAQQPLRDRVHAAALRLGLILRSYVQQPERREEMRKVLNGMLGEMREARNPLVPVGQAPEGTVDAEIDRLSSLLGALLVVLERLESLESATATERRTATKLEELRSEWQRAQDDLGSVEARAERAEAERSRLEAELRAARGPGGAPEGADQYRMKKEIDRLASQLDTTREERETLKKKLETATRLATEYQSKMVAAKRELESEKTEMQRQVEQRIASSEKAADERVADLKSTSKERYERQIAMLEREKRELQAELSKSRGDWEQTRRKLEDETAVAVATKEALARKVTGSQPAEVEKVSASEEIERSRARRRSSK